jgi:hypothetical protein
MECGASVIVMFSPRSAAGASQSCAFHPHSPIRTPDRSQKCSILFHKTPGMFQTVPFFSQAYQIAAEQSPLQQSLRNRMRKHRSRMSSFNLRWWPIENGEPNITIPDSPSSIFYPPSSIPHPPHPLEPTAHLCCNAIWF